MGIKSFLPSMKSAYPYYGPLHFYVDDESGLLLVEEPFFFRRKPGKEEVVPRGFMSDLASFPIIIRAVFKPWGRYTKPAVVHDFDYAEGKLSKLAADRSFYRGMKKLGVPWWKSLPFTGTVMTFGWIVWWRHRLRS